MLTTIAFASSFMATAFAVATPPSQACKQAALASPNQYDVVVCVNRQKAEAQLELIEELQAKRPQGMYFDLLRGNANWKLKPAQAVLDYRKAAQSLLSSGDPVRAMVAQSNAAQLLLWKLKQPKRAEDEIERLRQMYLRTEDPIAKRRGIILWCSFAADHDKNIGQAFQSISEITDQALESMSYFEKRDFLNTRARLSGLMLRFRAAQRDFRTLEETAAAQKPPDEKTQALALIDGLTIQLRQLSLQPEMMSRQFSQLQRDLKRSIVAAQKIKRSDLAAISLNNLAALYAGSNGHDQEAEQAIQQCLEITSQKGKNSEYHALCLASLSRQMEAKHPREAFLLAQKAQKMLGDSGLTELRLQAWRNLMRRAWNSQPRPQAMELAREALDAMEGLRSHQRDMTARQLMFTVWNQDYYWIASRLFALAQGEASYLDDALEILERSRARVLLEYMPGPDQSDKTEHSSKSFANIKELQSQLNPNEAMLVYQISNQQTFDGEEIGQSWILLITKNLAKPIPLPLERFELADAVSIVRDMAKADDTAMHLALDGLREKLLLPATSQLPSGISSLVIVADGPLHALPFFSIDSKFSYSIVPSATVWSQTRLRATSPALVPSAVSLINPQRKAIAATNATGRSQGREGKVEFDIDQPLIEGRREAVAIQESLSPTLRVLAGNAATATALQREWNAVDNLLHISAHSTVDTETPDQSKILLSNTGDERDGYLSVADIYQLPLNQSVVVLAGCSTGWGNWISGEGILSISRAFQIAGASAIVASLWPIRDREAADFFEAFYAFLGQGTPIAQALSAAQQHLREQNYPPQAYEGYVLIGDGAVRFEPKPARSPWLGYLIAALLGALMGAVLLRYWMAKRQGALQVDAPR